MSRAKPALARKPSTVKCFRAHWGYEGAADDELSFEEGDLVYISEQHDGGWWRGTCKGKSGLVPSNYLVADDDGENGGSNGQIDFPLHEGAKRGNLEWVDECLENKVPINGQDRSGSTGLYWAAYGGHVEVVERLLQNKFTDLNLQNKLGDSPLIAAAIRSHPEVVDLLLKAGADPSITNNTDGSALSVATNNQVKSLIKARLGLKTERKNQSDYIGAESDDDSDA